MDCRDLITQYYREHRDELLRYVRSRLGVAQCSQAVQAEDMVHDVFLRLLADADCRPITATTLHSLVFTMARNLLADHFRHWRCQQEYARLMRGYLPEEFQMEPVVYVHDVIRRMELGLSRLPQPCAEVYRLHIYDGMKAADISRQLHMDYKAVEYRLGQARREIRRLLRCS